jgi:hypothetical protein
LAPDIAPYLINSFEAQGIPLQPYFANNYNQRINTFQTVKKKYIPASYFAHLAACAGASAGACL